MWTTYWYVVFFCLPSNKKRRRSVCPSVFSTTVHSINFTHGRCTAEGPGKCRVECEVVGWVVLRNSAVVIHYLAELQRPCSYRRSSFRCGSYMELSRETVHSSQTGFTLILTNCTLINAFCMHRQSLVIWDPYFFFYVIYLKCGSCLSLLPLLTSAPALFLSGVCGAHADWCRPTGRPAECPRHQLHSGEPNTGIV